MTRPEPAYWLRGERYPLPLWLKKWRELLETAPPDELERLWTDPRHVEARKHVRFDSRYAPHVMRALGEAAAVAERRSGVPLRANRRRR